MSSSGKAHSYKAKTKSSNSKYDNERMQSHASASRHRLEQLPTIPDSSPLATSPINEHSERLDKTLSLPAEPEETRSVDTRVFVSSGSEIKHTDTSEYPIQNRRNSMPEGVQSVKEQQTSAQFIADEGCNLNEKKTQASVQRNTETTSIEHTQQSDATIGNSIKRTQTMQEPIGQADLSLRPRSRTATPWRGSSSRTSSVFARPRHQRPTSQTSNFTSSRKVEVIQENANEPNAITSSSSDAPQTSTPKTPQLTDVTSGSGGAKLDTTAIFRRRGHTLDIEHLMASAKASPAAPITTPAAVLESSNPFDIAMGSAYSSNLELKQHSHATPENIPGEAIVASTIFNTNRHVSSSYTAPSQIHKRESVSSCGTATTVETGESIPSSISTNTSIKSPKGQLSSIFRSEQAAMNPAKLTENENSFGTETQRVLRNVISSSAGSVNLTKGSQGGGSSELRLADCKSDAPPRPMQSALGATSRANSTCDQSSIVSPSTQEGIYPSMQRGLSESPEIEFMVENIPSASSAWQRKSSIQTGRRSGDSFNRDDVNRSFESDFGSGITRNSFETISPAPLQGAVNRNLSYARVAKGASKQQQPHYANSGATEEDHTSSANKGQMPAASAAYHHYRRESSHVPGLLHSIQSSGTFVQQKQQQQQQQQQQANQINSVGPISPVTTNATVPATETPATLLGVNNTDTGALSGTSGRVTSGASGGLGGTASKYPDLAPDNDVINDEAPNPWSFARNKGRKGTLKLHMPGKWNAVAPGPDNQPRCAIAGHDGLQVLSMDSDKINPTTIMTTGRRWTMGVDFKDVIWRPSVYITTGSHDGTVIVWDATRRSDQAVRKYNECSRPVNRLTSKPGDPYFIYSAFSDGSILGWDTRVQSRKPSTRMLASLSAQDVHCNPQNSNMVAAITQEGRIIVWDSRNTSKSVHNFVAHSAFRGQCIAWHPTGRFIGSGGSDQQIKIWDMVAATKKYTISPFCTFKAFAHIHKLQWRPGHDSQISSCSLSLDSRFHIWDMHNPNHSLIFHDKHTKQITGFSWFDENVVWSSSRDEYFVQCNMQTDSIYTAGLASKTVAAFSPTHHLAVATGDMGQFVDKCIEQVHNAQKIAASNTQADHGNTSGSASRSAEQKQLDILAQLPKSQDDNDTSSSLSSNVKSVAESLDITKFQQILPESFVDEHILPSDLSVKANAIGFLARNYQFDPDKFGECCSNNYRVALSVGFSETAKLWQFLSTLLNDALPLKKVRKGKKSRRGQGDKKAKSKAGSSKASSVKDGTESIIHVSRSVIDVLPEVGNTTDSAHNQYGGTSTPRRSLSKKSSRSSLSFAPLSPAIYNVKKHAELRFSDVHNALSTHPDPQYITSMLSSRPEILYDITKNLSKTKISYSQPNLRHALLSAGPSNIPSPIVRPITHSISNNIDYKSLSPLSGQNPVINPMQPLALDDQQSLQQSLRTSKTKTKDLDSLSRAEFFIPDSQTAEGEIMDLDEPLLSPKIKGLNLPPAKPLLMPPPNTAFNHATSYDRVDNTISDVRLNIKTKRHTTRTELALVVKSCGYYADKGDVQTAVTIALLMRRFLHLDKWAEAESWFHAYIGQLDMYGEFSSATKILLESPFTSTKDAVLSRNIVSRECSYCASTLMMVPDTGMSYCIECRRPSSKCVVCEQPVMGRYIWCQGCGHGGHADHLTNWFDELNQTLCPSGCGHFCRNTIVA